MTTSEIVKSVSVDNLVNQRAAVLAKLFSAFALLREADQLAQAAHLGFPDIGMNGYGGRDFEERITGSYRTSLQELEARAAKAVDAGAWGYLMKESGLRTFMDASARQAWDSKVRARDVPALTVENVNATFANLYDARGDMFDRGVISCFRSLSWDYKTNQPFKFGKRIIVRNLAHRYASGGKAWLSTNNGTTNRLDDLDRVFHVLDGQPQPDHRNGWYCKVDDAMRQQAGTAEGRYFNVKWYLNGNGHLVFQRQDLVDRMNQILARHFPNALATEAR